MQHNISVNCNLCGAHDEMIVSNIDRDAKPLTTVICNQCGLVYTNRRPSEEAIDNFYKNEYRVNYKKAFTPKIKHIYRAGQVALNRYALIKDILSADDHMLDIGSGGGEFLYLLKTLGYHAEGIEPNKGYANYAASQYGLDISNAHLQDDVKAGKQYSFITIYHVLEHMYDPASALQRLVELCEKDGHILVEVPNIEAVCQHPNNKFHLAHLYNFNLTTLSCLGEKLGLTVKSTFTTADQGNIVVIFQNIGKRNQESSFSGNAEKIKTILKSHTHLKHCLSPHPFTRLFRKAIGAMKENKISKHYQAGKALLDDLYRHLIK